MALTPGGARGPSIQAPPPSPTRTTPPRPSRDGRTPRWPRSASVAVLRLGALIGGLVIIADLGFLALMQRSLSAEDVQSWATLDEIVNYILFSVLGVLVVRETMVTFAGAIAGFLAGLLDAVVVTAAALMVPPPQPLEALRDRFIENLVIGTVFAGLSGVVFALVQRWPGGQRRR